MVRGKIKIVSGMLVLMLVMQILLPILSMHVLAAEETTTETGEAQPITRYYEIKEEEEWDISEKQDGSLKAKWTREDKTISISGTGEIVIWGLPFLSKENSEYRKIVEIINIEEGATSIGIYGFYECSSLREITIPSSVTSIEGGAFEGCSSLREITIPSSVTSIREDAFEGCSSLETIQVENGNKNYESENGILFNKGKSEIICYPSGKEGIDYTIPSSVTSIRRDAFKGCSSLREITIPSSVTSIRRDAFKGCSSLREITIPSSVTSISEGAFEGCSSLEKIQVENGNKNYESENGILFNKGKSEIICYPSRKEEIDYIIPSSVTSIVWDAFYGCSSLREITIPRSVTSIVGAFRECSSLREITIPSDVTEIGDYVFEGCSSLERITIPERVTSIGWKAFKGCSSLREINIPSSVTSIRKDAFEGCNMLILNVKADTEAHHYAEENKQGYILEGKASTYATDYEIKEEEEWDISEKQVGSVKVKWTRKDKTVNIYGTGGIQENMVFFTQNRHVDKYEKIVEIINIKEGVTSIGWKAFKGCSSLREVTIPSSVISIREGAFEGCGSLEKIQVDNGNQNYESEDGILFNKGKKAIIYYPSGKEGIDYTIPSSVTSIREGAFEGCSSLEKIQVDNGNQNYESEDGILFNKGKKAIIYYPSGKEGIDYTIPSSVTSIGEGAFLGCSSLTKITIPEGVTSIGEGAFLGCSSLTKITIPEGVTSIGRSAFEGCRILYVKSDTGGHRYAEKSKQGYIIDDIGPSVIYTPNTGATPQKSYDVKVSVIDNEETVGVNKDSLKYQWTQSKEEPKKESFKEQFTNQQTISKDTGDGEWYLWVYAKDNLGNETIKRSEKFNIDNTSPIARVEYSVEQSGVITVTIKANEMLQGVEGWTLLGDTLSREYEGNVLEESIIIKDLAGNSSTVNINRAYVISEDSQIEGGYTVQYEYLYINDVARQCTVIIQGPIISVPTGWTASDNSRSSIYKTFFSNEKEIINQGYLINEVTVNVNKIVSDNIPPTAEISYSTKEPTNGNVTVTITANEAVQAVKGWKLSEDKKTLTKEYSENTTEKITIKDLAGNEKIVEVKISNINKDDKTVKSIAIKKNPNKMNYYVGDRLNTEGLTLEVSYNNGKTEEVTTGFTCTPTELETEGMQEIKVAYQGKEVGKFEVTVTKKSTIPEDKVKKGDINQDGEIDIIDILKLLRHIATKNSEQTAQKYPDWILTGDRKKAADINNDTNIDIIDILKLLRHIAADKSEETARKHPDWIIQ